MISEVGSWEKPTYIQLRNTIFVHVCHWLKILQVTLISNIIAVEKHSTHTDYVLDNGMGMPAHICIWNKAGKVWPEQHALKFIMQTHHSSFGH